MGYVGRHSAGAVRASRPRTIPVAEHLQRSADALAFLSRYPSERVFRFYPLPYLCDRNAGQCLTHSERELYYYDGGHLTPEGAALFAEPLREAIEALINPPR